MAKIYSRPFTASYHIVSVPTVDIDLMKSSALVSRRPDRREEARSRVDGYLKNSHGMWSGEWSNDELYVLDYPVWLKNVNWSRDFADNGRVELDVSGIAETDDSYVAKDKDDMLERIDMILRENSLPMQIKLREISLGAGKKPRVSVNPQDATAKRMMNPRNY